MILEKYTGINTLNVEEQFWYVNSCLSYNEETGVLSWREDRPSSTFRDEKNEGIWKRRYGGTEAGYVSKAGYVRVGLNDKEYSAHRLAFLLKTKRWPKVVDHINGNKSDNSWNNLREVCKVVNGKNMKRNKRNTSGFNGVYFDNNREKWVANGNETVESKNYTIFLGRHDTFEEAVKARQDWQDSVGGYTTRHGK